MGKEKDLTPNGQVSVRDVRGKGLAVWTLYLGSRRGSKEKFLTELHPHVHHLEEVGSR